jgi:hypothetical protein
MCTAAAAGPEVNLSKPTISPVQIINCALLILNIVRFLDITPNAAKTTMQPNADAAAPNQADGPGAAWWPGKI